MTTGDLPATTTVADRIDTELTDLDDDKVAAQ